MIPKRTRTLRGEFDMFRVVPTSDKTVTWKRQAVCISMVTDDCECHRHCIS
jgi:hypothetical protein